MKKYLVYVGIDTGTNTGLAVYDSINKHLTVVETLPIHRALEFVSYLHRAHGNTLFVRFEDARLRKWVPKHTGRERLQGAGSVKRDAAIWEAFLKDNCIPYEAVAPKNNKTKMSAEYFKKITGWRVRCSEHARDAAALVIGF